MFYVLGTTETQESCSFNGSFQKVPEVVENRNKMSCGNTPDKL